MKQIDYVTNVKNINLLFNLNKVDMNEVIAKVKAAGLVWEPHLSDYTADYLLFTTIPEEQC